MDLHNELYAALAQAQAEFPLIEKNRSAHYGAYADAADMLNPLWPTLKKYGLSLREEMSIGADDKEILMVWLCHSSGQAVSSMCLLKPKGDKDADWGGCITYRRRYLYRGILGLAIPDDVDDHDDGNEEQGANEITSDQYHELLALMKACANGSKLWGDISSYNKIERLEYLPASSFNSVKKYIQENKK